MIPRPGATESATRETRWQKRPREFSESEELTQRNPSLNVNRTGNGGKTAWSSPRRAAVAELDKESKRTRLSLPSRSQEVSGPIEAHDSSRAPHPHCVKPVPITPTGPNTDTIIIPDDSDTAEKQQRKSTAELSETCAAPLSCAPRTSRCFGVGSCCSEHTHSHRPDSHKLGLLIKKVGYIALGKVIVRQPQSSSHHGRSRTSGAILAGLSRVYIQSR